VTVARLVQGKAAASCRMTGKRRNCA